MHPSQTAFMKNAMEVCARKTQEFVKDGDCVLIDISSAFTRIPFESVLNGLLFMENSFTIIEYIMHMLQARHNTESGSALSGVAQGC